MWLPASMCGVLCATYNDCSLLRLLVSVQANQCAFLGGIAWLSLKCVWPCRELSGCVQQLGMLLGLHTAVLSELYLAQQSVCRLYRGYELL